VRLEGLGQLKKSNDVGNRTRGNKIRRILYPEMKVIILLDVPVCSHVHVHRHFEEIIKSYRNIRRYIPEDIILHSHRCENQISKADPEIFRIQHIDWSKANSFGMKLM
jgi:hypothetical protein